MKKTEDFLLEEQIKFENHVKKNNWILMVVAVITIPFLVSNM
ncbi:MULTISPECIES: hypothetical protein [unclassified Bacillus (in: firmicutes)]|nr:MULTISPECIES: hypothetical protein [unclassified Bacillus (in: firmicutes)]